jgi:hypothetical protein
LLQARRRKKKYLRRTLIERQTSGFGPISGKGE